MAALILEMHSVGPLQTNAYILSDPDAGEAILVDPGAEATRLLAAIESTGCRLKYLVCTHGHFDHIADAATIQNVVDLPLLCHPDEEKLIQHLPDAQASWGFPVSTVPRVDCVLTDGHILQLGAEHLTVRHIPGHSPGHILLAWTDNALVGDLIFAGSIGRTDLPGSSFPDLERSIREVVYKLPPDTKLHPGHGPATRVDLEMRDNPYVPATS